MHEQSISNCYRYALLMSMFCLEDGIMQISLTRFKGKEGCAIEFTGLDL